MRVLLLNPPGRDLYIRDYFCSKTTKSNYLFHPIDLLVLSGVIAERHTVEVIDAIAERLSVPSSMERIQRFSPDAIISLVGAVSWEEDREFLRWVKEKTGASIYVIGDLIHDGGETIMSQELWIDGCFQNFINGDALALIEQRDEDIADATIRRSGVPKRVQKSIRNNEYTIPIPRHDLFPEDGYSFSFARRKQFATMLTDYGCPYPCTFCVIGTLGFQQRPIENVIEEMKFLDAKGIRELFVMDQTFGLVRSRGIALCERMVDEHFHFGWTTFARPDLIDNELLSAMHRAGCHTLVMGVETADDDLLDRYKKGYHTDEVHEGFARARRAGMQTVGTFIIGVPEDNEESIRRMVDYAIDLDMDFASFNLAVPRAGTAFRVDTIAKGLADSNVHTMDQGGATPSMPTMTLTRERMHELHHMAIRKFYFRPSYLVRRLLCVRTVHELRSQIAEGFALFRRVS